MGTVCGTYINAPNKCADALGVDAESLTGATRLYQRAGMAVVRQFTLWEKELWAGIDLSTQHFAE